MPANTRILLSTSRTIPYVQDKLITALYICITNAVILLVNVVHVVHVVYHEINTVLVLYWFVTLNKYEPTNYTTIVKSLHTNVYDFKN